MSVLVKAKFYDTNFQKVETVYVGVYIDVYMDFPVVLVLKNVPANAGDVRNACWITGLGRSPGWEDAWRRIWQPIPVSLPGKFNGQRSLAGYSP